jgi:hypothetical protein
LVRRSAWLIAELRSCSLIWSTFKNSVSGVAQARHLLLHRGTCLGCGTSASPPTPPGNVSRVWHKRVTSRPRGTCLGCGTSASPLHLPMLLLLAFGVHKNPPLKIMPRYRGNHPSLPTA